MDISEVVVKLYHNKAARFEETGIPQNLSYTAKMLRAVLTEEELGNIVHSPRGREGHEENKTYVSANKHRIIGKKSSTNQSVKESSQLPGRRR